MTELSSWTLADVAEFTGDCMLLMRASCCNGLRDEIAQGLDRDVLRLLNGIADRNLHDHVHQQRLGRELRP